MALSGTALASAVHGVGWRRVGILHKDDAAGQQQVDAFKSRALETGLDLVSSFSFPIFVDQLEGDAMERARESLRARLQLLRDADMRVIVLISSSGYRAVLDVALEGPKILAVVQGTTNEWTTHSAGHTAAGTAVGTGKTVNSTSPGSHGRGGDAVALSVHTPKMSTSPPASGRPGSRSPSKLSSASPRALRVTTARGAVATSSQPASPAAPTRPARPTASSSRCATALPSSRPSWPRRALRLAPRAAPPPARFRLAPVEITTPSQRPFLWVRGPPSDTQSHSHHIGPI